ncbi:rhodanese-like domain-containing protein [Carnobacterium gallinarum]|uniref:rhodanese-like domain-containing protein n=1 Tax=Carnobacterium gallinarum TaxID=2749 RepID=UPI00054CEE11|nr:rhodanese-like domain-containing protein [Carnobacterium gallinarum]
MFGLFQRTATISTNELMEKLEKSSILLDVRTTEEYQRGHISTAKNVPLNKISNYKYKHSSEIYVICQSGMRSKQATNILKKKGYQAINVRGGMNRWTGPVKGGRN